MGGPERGRSRTIPLLTAVATGIISPHASLSEVMAGVGTRAGSGSVGELVALDKGLTLTDGSSGVGAGNSGRVGEASCGEVAPLFQSLS
jgi:hypothetical protein